MNHPDNKRTIHCNCLATKQNENSHQNHVRST